MRSLAAAKKGGKRTLRIVCTSGNMALQNINVFTGN